MKKIKYTKVLIFVALVGIMVNFRFSIRKDQSMISLSGLMVRAQGNSECSETDCPNNYQGAIATSYFYSEDRIINGQKCKFWHWGIECLPANNDNDCTEEHNSDGPSGCYDV